MLNYNSSGEHVWDNFFTGGQLYEEMFALGVVGDAAIYMAKHSEQSLYDTNLVACLLDKLIFYSLVGIACVYVHICAYNYWGMYVPCIKWWSCFHVAFVVLGVQCIFLHSSSTCQRELPLVWWHWHWILWWGWSDLPFSVSHAPSQGPDGIPWKVFKSLHWKSVW